MITHSAAALWLLPRSGVTENDAPVIGDLLEEYASGRSAGWLWYQTISLVVVRAAHDLRAHKWLALRVVITGLLVILAATALKHRVTSFPGAGGVGTFWLLTYASFLLTAWVIGLTHRKHKMAMLFAFVAYAAFAKAFVFATHFHHYWNMAHPYRSLLDVSLTLFGICLIVVGGAFAPGATTVDFNLDGPVESEPIPVRPS